MDTFNHKLEDFRELFNDKDCLPYDKAMAVKKILGETDVETLEFLSASNINFVSQAASNILNEKRS